MNSETKLTSFKLSEYPHFSSSNTKRILDKIKPPVRNKISVVIGMTDLNADMDLAYNIARTLNKERGVSDETTKGKLSCRAIYYRTKTILGLNILSRDEGFEAPKEEDFVLFIHCCLEDPGNDVFYKNLPKLKKECEKDFLFSELLRNKRRRNFLFMKSFFPKIDLSVILPTPKKEYLDFIQLIEK